MFRRRQQQQPAPLSDFSSAAVPPSGWAAMNFLLGAGMVIFQPSTDKVVVVHESKRNSYFFPRGRKDVGESLEQTALREAYEESGYRVEFLPLYTFTSAPSSPHDREAAYRPNTEPIYTTLTPYRPVIRRGQIIRDGGEYITSWYVGQIPEDAVRELGTGMPDEQDYESHLFSIERAYNVLSPPETCVLKYAWTLYRHTMSVGEGDGQAAQNEEGSTSQSS